MAEEELEGGAHILVRKAEKYVATLLKAHPAWIVYFGKELCEKIAHIVINLKLHYSSFTEENNTPSLRAFYPGVFNIFQNVFKLPPDQVRVIFVADPEEGNTFIDAFGTKSGEMSERFLNIRNVIAGNEFGTSHKLFPDFSHWTSQGVLMLPTTFTSHPLPPKSHKKMWKKVLIDIIKSLDINLPEVVWAFVGASNFHLTDNLIIRGRDIRMDEFTNANLPSLYQQAPFEQIDKKLNEVSKALRPKLEWL